MVVSQEAQHRVDRAQPLEQVKDQADHRLDLLIRIQDHLTRGAAHETGGQRHGQLSPPRLGQPPRPHPLFNQVQLGLADRPLQPQQEPVIVVGRVVYPVRIGQQGPRQGTQLKELVRFPATARQPGHLDAQHDAHVTSPTSETRRWKPGRTSTPDAGTLLQQAQAVPGRGHPLRQARAHLPGHHRRRLDQHLATRPRPMIHGTRPRPLSAPALAVDRLRALRCAQRSTIPRTRLFEADCRGCRHPAEQWQRQRDDPEGDHEADAHDRVVVPAEPRDRVADRREPQERQEGRPVGDVGATTVAATSGTAASNRTTRDSTLTGVPLTRSRVNGRFLSTRPPAETARLQPATISVSATAAYRIFSNVVARASRICSSSPNVRGGVGDAP